MFCVLRFAARVSGEIPLNVPKARIIAAGCIISEAASFARKGKHHSQRCAGNARPFLFPFHTSPFTRDRVIIIII